MGWDSEWESHFEGSNDVDEHIMNERYVSWTKP